MYEKDGLSSGEETNRDEFTGDRDGEPGVRSILQRLDIEIDIGSFSTPLRSTENQTQHDQSILSEIEIETSHLEGPSPLEKI